MMVQGDFSTHRYAGRRKPLQDSGTARAVGFHEFKLARCVRGWFEQDRVRDDDLANVMHRARASNAIAIFPAHAQRLCQVAGIMADAPHMIAACVIPVLGGANQCFDGFDMA